MSSKFLSASKISNSNCADENFLKIKFLASYSPQISNLRVMILSGFQICALSNLKRMHMSGSQSRISRHSNYLLLLLLPWTMTTLKVSKTKRFLLKILKHLFIKSKAVSKPSKWRRCWQAKLPLEANYAHK